MSLNIFSFGRFTYANSETIYFDKKKKKMTYYSIN